MIDKLKQSLLEFDNSIFCVEIATHDIVFEERIKLLCFHCKNYNYKFTCPPKIPKLSFENIIKNEYSKCLVVYTNMTFTENNYTEIRNLSTNKIHKALLHLEKVLFENNISTSLSLIGGSCKLCKTGCPSEKCNNPYISRMPMEATGINVVATVKNVGIEIKFPVVDNLCRCGLLLW